MAFLQGVRRQLVPCSFLLLAFVSGPAFAQETSSFSDEEALLTSILRELGEIKALLQALVEEQQHAKVAVPSITDGGRRVVVLDINGPLVGSDDAPLALAEFTNHECAYCQIFYNTTLQRLKEAYIDGGVLQYTSIFVPLNRDSKARDAAKALFCGAKEGKYWAMRSAQYSREQLQTTDFMEIAEEIGIDVKEFRNCLAGEEAQRAVEHDVTVSQAVGVAAVPTFVLGRVANGQLVGTMFKGVTSLDTFETIISALLPTDVPR